MVESGSKNTCFISTGWLIIYLSCDATAALRRIMSAILGFLFLLSCTGCSSFFSLFLHFLCPFFLSLKRRLLCRVVLQLTPMYLSGLLFLHFLSALSCSFSLLPPLVISLSLPCCPPKIALPLGQENNNMRTIISSEFLATKNKTFPLIHRGTAWLPQVVITFLFLVGLLQTEQRGPDIIITMVDVWHGSQHHNQHDTYKNIVRLPCNVTKRVFKQRSMGFERLLLTIENSGAGEGKKNCGAGEREKKMKNFDVLLVCDCNVGWKFVWCGVGFYLWLLKIGRSPPFFLFCLMSLAYSLRKKHVYFYSISCMRNHNSAPVVPTYLVPLILLNQCQLNTMLEPTNKYNYK
ncbi:hypothetical protein VP01_2807g1 [Puccinia sorghi]|uniref:Uncharacterized protein n=1 Tax=Puccinia sorghi TaxID=27349 RepID=A0A0L6V374_9BASI|nr:hypothetical protein VP01_2807g1 [Puccinia sorghi]